MSRWVIVSRIDFGHRFVVFVAFSKVDLRRDGETGSRNDQTLGKDEGEIYSKRPEESIVQLFD